MFRLAYRLGKTVAELDMPWSEFLMWQAYFEIEHPEEGETKRTAALMAQITNMAGRSLPKDKTVKAEDFLPKKPQTAKEQQAILRALSGK